MTAGPLHASGGVSSDPRLSSDQVPRPSGRRPQRRRGPMCQSGSTRRSAHARVHLLDAHVHRGLPEPCDQALADRQSLARRLGGRLLLARWVLDRKGVEGRALLPPNDWALTELLVKAASGLHVNRTSSICSTHGGSRQPTKASHRTCEAACDDAGTEERLGRADRHQFRRSHAREGCAGQWQTGEDMIDRRRVQAPATPDLLAKTSPLSPSFVLANAVRSGARSC